MKIFISGADGMLGSNIVAALVNRGHEVRAFLLPGRSYRSLDGFDIERAYGNLLNAADVDEAMTGCQAAIHAAADTSVWPSRSKQVWDVNVEGTRNILAAAKNASVKRFVHIGSASSFGLGPKENPADEATVYASRKYGLDYCDSKHEAHNLVLRAVKEEGFPAIIVTPTFMFGPFDSKPGSGQMILAIAEKKLPAFASGGKNFVCSKDVAVAVANALTMGRVGECYIAGHENLSFREITSLIAEELNVLAPKFETPSYLLKMVGGLSTVFAKIFKFKPKISYAMALIACDGQYFSSQKAIEELQLPQTDIRVGVREAYNWFEEHGYCD